MTRVVWAEASQVEMATNPVTLECPLCRGMIQVDASAGGQQVACPLCFGTMQVPPLEMLLGPASPPPVVAPPPVTGLPMAPSPASPPAYAPLSPPVPVSLMPLACPSCGGTFQVPPSAAGMQLPCPACGQLVTIPEPSAAAAESVSPPPKSPPPAAAPEPQPFRPSEPSAATGLTDVAALLPPGAVAGAAPPAEFFRSAPVPDVASLLPPGAADGAVPGGPVPLSPALRPILVSQAAASILVPTPDGQVVALQEKPKVIGQGDQQVEVRRLTSAEKARRRLVRNVILFILGVSGLLAIVIYMSR